MKTSVNAQKLRGIATRLRKSGLISKLSREKIIKKLKTDVSIYELLLFL
jgi:hypothetical protein